MDRDPTLADLAAALGAATVVVGTYVPWIVAAPGHRAVPSIYISGIEWGIAGMDYLVLSALVVGLGAAARYRHRRLGGALAAATGVGVAGLTSYYAVEALGVAATVPGLRADGFFVAGTGVYVTLAGGGLLAAAGLAHAARGVPDAKGNPDTHTDSEGQDDPDEERAGGGTAG